MSISYLVTGEKLLPGGNIEKIRSAYKEDQFVGAIALLGQCLLNDGYSKMQIEVRKYEKK